MWTRTISTNVSCPYCGEAFEHIVDPGADQQAYIEDCYVCCRPIHMLVTIDNDGDVLVVARDENEC